MSQRIFDQPFALQGFGNIISRCVFFDHNRYFLSLSRAHCRFVAAQAGNVDIALTSATLATTDIDGMHVEKVDSVDNRGITLPTVPDEGKTTEDGYKIGNNITCDVNVRKARG